ncbi:helix-turn-helix domain-containing protein, partial [Stenotrophomonas maltophilia]|uniref:helix-turn-helix domain-containing protein n=1 Tax=Stenotrophomonas maltophilia TaxID=40324 RepID=UPI0019548788
FLMRLEMGLQLSAPFGKAGLCHGQVVGQVIAQRAPADLVVNKWDMFKDLTECRRQLEISDRALAVIYALLT